MCAVVNSVCPPPVPSLFGNKEGEIGRGGFSPPVSQEALTWASLSPAPSYWPSLFPGSLGTGARELKSETSGREPASAA